MTKDTFKKILLLITYTLVVLTLLLNISNIAIIIKRIFRLLMPLWIGIFLAFVLNVPMSAIEKKIFKKTNKKIRFISISLCILMICLVMLLLFMWVIPDLINSITNLLKELPNIINDINNLINNSIANTELENITKDINLTNNLNDTLSSIFKYIINNFTALLANSFSVIVNILTGLIIAIYFLYDKEKMLKNGRRIVNKVFEKNIIKKIDKVKDLSVKAFHDFIAYQVLECIILGSIMFIAFKLFNFPYALTIAFTTATTAIVPIFGATIACVIGAILIGTKSIAEAIIFIIVYQIIQQIENNLIYPHVVGKHVGLPPILTILAIIVGGKIGGILGILICIPLTAVLNTLFWGMMKKDIPKIVLPSTENILKDIEK